MPDTYTEDEIRLAMTRLGGSARDLLAELEKTAAVRHPYTDASMIPVREIRRAFANLLPDDCCRQCRASFHAGDKPSEVFLHEISKLHHAQYTDGKVYRAANGQYVKHRDNGTWWIHGNGHAVPMRPEWLPLTEMP